MTLKLRLQYVMSVERRWIFLVFLDANIKSIDEQYRQIEGLVSIDDIQKIMDIYNIGESTIINGVGIW